MRGSCLATLAAALLAGIAASVAPTTAHAQLRVTPTRDAQTLVQNLVGQGITVQGATYSGGSVLDPLFGLPIGEAAGVFTGGPQGIRDGIVITNGDANLMLPPNYMDDATGVLAPEVYLMGGVEADPLCQKVIGEADYGIFDPVRLTIDFTVAQGYDGLQIDYLFGSEEYPEYVGDVFADAFGFYVGERGAPESSYTNIGLDLEDAPININGPFFRGGSVVEDVAATQYDGTTPRLTSTIRLQPGGAYRMIIVVCDAGDEYLDSGVFLAALGGCQGECDGTYVCVEGKHEDSCNEEGGPQIPVGNVAPVVANDSARATAGTLVQVDVLANDHEPNGDPMTVRAVSIADHGTAAIVDGRFIAYTPASSFNGSEVLQVQVCDPYGACAVSVLTVEVTGGTGTDPGPDPGTDPGPGPGTDPGTGPTPGDRDGDGLLDAAEIAAGTDPDARDTDGDGLLDGEETGTDALDADSDDDGLADGVERIHGTDPSNPDSDGDGLSDGLEVGVTSGVPGGTSAGGAPFQGTEAEGFGPDLDPATRTDPKRPDSDGDGIADGVEDTNLNGRVDPGERNPALVDGFAGPGGSTRPGCAGGLVDLSSLVGLALALVGRHPRWRSRGGACRRTSVQ